MKQRETDVAERVMEHFAADGWDLYPEVEAHGGGPRADMVGLRGAEVLVCEVKAVLCLDLLAQAHAWRTYATRVYAAAPAARAGSFRGGRVFAADAARKFGFGLLEVGGTDVFERVAPRVSSALQNPRLRDAARPEHKMAAPSGSRGGGHWTRFRDTAEQLRRVVAENPGLRVREAVVKLRHHYASSASAEASLSTWARLGKLDGVEVRRADGASRFYPTEAAK